MNRSRFSDYRGPNIGAGRHPDELWGAAQKDPPAPRRARRLEQRRSDSAVARRRAKRAARAAGMPLKVYLRARPVAEWILMRPLR